MDTEADVALASMSAFVDGLASRAVGHACLSPGSRSTPLALALARHPGVRVHVHLDERSSAFFALGLAKASGAPVVVACTSGTAAANLFPAVVEASMSRVPLVVLTADRPPELRGVGANQTIDQVELYGRYVRAFTDAPVPGEAPSTDEWRARGADAARASLESVPGPVHVNLPFREPLVPETPPSHAAPEPPTRGDRQSDIGSGFGSDERDVAVFVEKVSSVRRGLVYAGGLRSGGTDVCSIAERLGWPLIAEPHSGARLPGAALAAGQLLLDNPSFAEAYAPDAVLQVGAAPTSRAGLALARRASALLIVDPDDLVADPARRAVRRIVTAPAAVTSALSDHPATADDRWRQGWRTASDRVSRAVDALLATWDEPFEGRIARDLAAEAPNGTVLCVGPSMPVRDLDAFMLPRLGLRVLANRGVSGIDGFVSTTLGAAASARPTVALLGDLTLLYDIGALVWNAGRGSNAVFVVPNNGGGAIFSLLDQRALPELQDLFVTPHGVDLGALIGAAGVGHVRVDRASELAGSVAAARDTGGLHVVEIPIDPERDRRRRADVRRAVARAIG